MRPPADCTPFLACSAVILQNKCIHLAVYLLYQLERVPQSRGLSRSLARFLETHLEEIGVRRAPVEHLWRECEVEDAIPGIQVVL